MKHCVLHGVILGDLAGSQYERHGTNIDTTDFQFPDEQSFFTDDTVMTLAVAQTIMEGEANPAIINKIAPTSFRNVAAEYKLGGHLFRKWLANKTMGPYGSFGNGAIMRIMPAGLAARTDKEATALARAVTNPTHNHPDAVKCATAMARAIRRLRDGEESAHVARLLAVETGLVCTESYEAIRKSHRFRVTAAETLPIAVKLWQESKTLEEALRLAVSLGGDADTNASVTGAFCAMTYGVPDELAAFAESKLDAKLLDILQKWQEWFTERFKKKSG